MGVGAWSATPLQPQPWVLPESASDPLARPAPRSGHPGPPRCLLKPCPCPRTACAAAGGGGGAHRRAAARQPRGRGRRCRLPVPVRQRRHWRVCAVGAAALPHGQVGGRCCRHRRRAGATGRSSLACLQQPYQHTCCTVTWRQPALGCPDFVAAGRPPRALPLRLTAAAPRPAPRAQAAQGRRAGAGARPCHALSGRPGGDGDGPVPFLGAAEGRGGGDQPRLFVQQPVWKDDPDCH